MKTTKDVIHYVGERMESTLTRPQMYAESASALEIQFLNMLEISLFILERDINVFDSWRKFAHKETGYSGPWPVGVWLKKNNKLNDDWKELTELLSSFAKLSLSSNG